MSGYRPPRPGGIPTECKNCAAPLGPHNITGWCAECKLIARNERLSGQPADTVEPVILADAIQHVVAILGGRIISDTVEQAGQ